VATLAVIVAIMLMAPSPPTGVRRESMLESIRYGIAFLARHRILRWIVGVFVVTALLTRPYAQLIPAFIVNTLRGGPQALGWAVAAAGVGGFGGALVTAYFAQGERRSRLWLWSGVIMSGGVLALGFIWSVAFAVPVLFAIGLGTLAFLGATNTLIQTLSPDHVRGRAISVYTMIAIGVVPLGSLVVGSVASVTGMHAAFLGAGGICLVLIVSVYALNRLLRTV
jgi:MFS family permease